MCEIGPGIYTAPRLTKGVRERLWAVLTEWFERREDESVLMTWPDESLPGGQEVLTLGLPRVQLCCHDGVYLVRRQLPAGSEDSGVAPGTAGTLLLFDN
jgi:CRISPR-associated protein Cas2